MKASKSADRQPLGWRYGPPLALLFAVCVIYANSLDNAFVFDDLVYIVDNPDIQHIWPLWQSPTESTWPALNARPLVRLTLAFNYALHGLEPRGYHLVNLGIHLLCSLSIYGLARRALAAVHFDGDAPGLGLAIAMVWTVHPINSECINYLSQRSESLMALFYLLTLYCTLRGRLGIRSAQWNIAAVSCAVLGTRVRTQWANDVPFGRPDPIEKDHACQPPDHDIVCTHSASATDYQQDPLGQISLPSNPVFIGVFLLGFDFSSSYLVPE